MIAASVVVADPASASDSNNNFGSSTGADAAEKVYLGDSAIHEWSVWTTWFSVSTSFFDDKIHTQVEGAWEPTQLTINRGARNTEQDVAFVPVEYIDAPDLDGPAAKTVCNTANAAIYGTHHHRICDKKIVFVSMEYWYYFVYVGASYENDFTIGHEFGHTVGVRHSGTPSPLDIEGCGAGVTCGTTDLGALVATTHDSPLTSVMKTFSSGCWCTSTTGDRARVNHHY